MNRPVTSLPTSRRTRSPRGRLLTALVSTLSLLLGLGPVTSAGAATVVPFASLSGHQIMTSALAAATSMSSCTSSTTTKVSGQDYSSVTNSALTTGQQTLTIGDAWTVVRVVGGVVYVKENASAMREQFGVDDPAAVNRWIEIPRTNSNFARFNAYILLSSLLSEISPAGTLKTTRPSTVGHRLVVGVTGKPNIHLGLASGTETVFVSVSAPHVPIEMTASDVVQGQRQNFVINFTNWGANFRIVKPNPVLPISSTKLPS